jgi:hypothetical protein
VAEQDKQDSISRREFASRVGRQQRASRSAAACSSREPTPPHVGSRIIGANDHVVTASIGVAVRATR